MWTAKQDVAGTSIVFVFVQAQIQGQGQDQDQSFCSRRYLSPCSSNARSLFSTPRTAKVVVVAMTISAYMSLGSCISLFFTNEFWHGRCGDLREMLGGDRLDTWLRCGGMLGVGLRVGLGFLLLFVRVLRGGFGRVLR